MPFILPAHTGLRAIAALLVVAFHFSISIGEGGSVVNSVLRRGYLGVDLFFVLSGFIIHHVYRTKINVENLTQRFPEFLRYRLARIYPVHLFLLVVMISLYLIARFAGLTSGDNTNYTIFGIIAALFLFHGWFDIAAPNSVSWSVSAEWAAYLLYPAALALGQKVALLLKIALLIAGLLLLHFYWNDVVLIRIFVEFSLGVAAYEVARRVLHRLGRIRFLGILIAAVSCIAIGAPSDVLIVPVVLTFAGLLIALTNKNDYLARGLSGAIPIYLGEISYSLYMTHSPLREVLKQIAARFGLQIHSLAGMVISLVLALILGALVYHFVEMPARRFFRGRKAGIPQETTLSPLGNVTPVPLSELSK